ncbi:MAG TPA: hypothetical protein PKD86_00705 [Gemmatales bacterium]|nr:hypothetical protein [Gemmatales bacterium]HMP57844.1 hypothetical protein [Gemmatales bacterium]
MTSTWVRHLTLMITMAAALYSAGCSSKSEAERDIAAGNLRLKKIESEEPGVAKNDPEFVAFAALLKEKCGVEVVYVLKPTTDDEKAEIEHYNNRMQQEIDKRFGAGTLVKLRGEAKLKAAGHAVGTGE